MGEAYLAWFWAATPANERRTACCMVWRPKRPTGNDGIYGFASEAVKLSYGDLLFGRQGREKSEARLFASIVLPAPGGPVRRTL